MIVTTGRSIKIEAGYQLRWEFERTADAPGVVYVTIHNHDKTYTRFQLPANEEEAKDFIKAYERAISEDVGYRDRNVE